MILRMPVIAVVLLLVTRMLGAPPGLAQDVVPAKSQQESQALHKQEESLQGGGQNTATSPGAAAKSELAHPGFEGLNKTIEAAHQDWPGSFGVPGGDTRIKISGFAELDIMYDTDAIETPGVFLPAAIETRDATAAQRGYSQLNYTIQSTRLSIETRTPLHNRKFTTFIAVDFLSDLTTTAPELHMRQAYGELTGILFGGDLRFGHDWATFSSVDSIPNVLDAQAPNAFFVTRHPMVRWTRDIGTGLKLQLAAEATDVHLFEGAAAISRWPDGVAALIWEHDSVLLQGSFLARDLRASDSSGQVDAAFGWGGNLSGRIHMPGNLVQDFVSFSLTFGDGIGGVMNDTPPDAVYNAETLRLETIPTLAWFASYQHWWNPTFFSVMCYGEVEQDTLDIQEPTAYRKTQYSSANLTWTPFEQWLFGIEVLYGTREDKDGARGSDIRTLLVTRFNF